MVMKDVAALTDVESQIPQTVDIYPITVIDSIDDKMEYGHSTFRDGTVVPFCKFLPDVIIGSINNEPTPIVQQRGPYQWSASEIKATRSTRDGKGVYILEIGRIIVGIVSGLPVCWFSDGKYRMDNIEHEMDLI